MLSTPPPPVRHIVDGSAYEVYPDGALARALAERDAALAAYMAFRAAPEQQVIQAYTEARDQLAQLEGAADEQYAPLAALAVDIEQEVKIAALRRRVARLQGQYDHAVAEMGKAARTMQEAAAAFEEVEQQVRVARQRVAALVEERATFERQWAIRMAAAQRDQRLVLGDLKPGDVRQQHSPDSPAPFWPEGTGYVPDAPVVVQRQIRPEEREALKQRYLHPWYPDYDKGQDLLQRGAFLVQYRNGVEVKGGQ